MAVRTQNCTREYLGTIPLPNHADTYTVISHEFVISNTLEQLALHGFTVADEKYRANSDGSIAQGIYYLNYTKDPEVGMMFAWSNSYNKLMRFKCGIGGYVFICMNGVVSGDMGSYSRRHSGTADSDTIKTIIDQISNADAYFDQILSDKDTMKKITLTERKQAELLGILYAEYEILTTEQMSTVKQQIDRPGYDYNCEVNSLWAFYNHVTYALKKSHPKDWMEDQRKLHLFISMEFDLLNYSEPDTTEDIDLEFVDLLELNYGEPENQLNILTEIEKAEVEAELVQAIEEREEAEKDVLFYEDPAGNTFETVVLDDIKIHIESDPEYNARVAAIEGEPEVEAKLSEFAIARDQMKADIEADIIDEDLRYEAAQEEGLTIEEYKEVEDEIVLPTTDQIIFEGLKAADDAKAKRENESIVTLTEDELASQLYGVDNDPEYSAPVIEDEVEVEVEEVKPTETKIVDDWDDDDFNFDLDDTKKDDHGGEFFL